MGLFSKNKEPKDSFYNVDNKEYEKEQEELSKQEFPTAPVDEHAEEIKNLLKELQNKEENNE
jgi:hypothetical protein